MEHLFKVLDNRRSCHGGDHLWVPNQWVTVEGKLEPCSNGLHLCRARDLFGWLGPEIWLAQYRGERIDADDKVVVRSARITMQLDAWNDCSTRLFACLCAEQALPFFERVCPGDERPRKTIEVARRFANGTATREELDAAWDAAGDAAWAAWAAAGDAAWAAGDAAWAAGAAAGDAAWAAAGAAWAAGAAAGDAARDAAREWQTEQLMKLLGLA